MIDEGEGEETQDGDDIIDGEVGEDLGVDTEWEEGAVGMDEDQLDEWSSIGDSKGGGDEGDGATDDPDPEKGDIIRLVDGIQDDPELGDGDGFPVGYVWGERGESEERFIRLGWMDLEGKLTEEGAAVLSRADGVMSREGYDGLLGVINSTPAEEFVEEATDG